MDISWQSILGHEKPITRLRTLLAENRLPHALLFAGPDGVGKLRVARTLALLASGLGDGAQAELLSYEPLSHAGLRKHLAGRRPGSRTAADVFFIVRRDWPDADAEALGRSQASWRASDGDGLLSRMLREDPRMRAAGVELLLLRRMDALLSQETVSAADERALSELCQLRTACLADAAAATP